MLDPQISKLILTVRVNLCSCAQHGHGHSRSSRQDGYSSRAHGSSQGSSSHGTSHSSSHGTSHGSSHGHSSSHGSSHGHGSSHSSSHRSSGRRPNSAPHEHRRNGGGSSRGYRPPGEEIYVGKYKLLKTIGKGNFAKVKLARHMPTGQEVCVQYLTCIWLLMLNCAIKPAQYIRTYSGFYLAKQSGWDNLHMYRDTEGVGFRKLQ